jgi:hypothetical protein
MDLQYSVHLTSLGEKPPFVVLYRIYDMNLWRGFGPYFDTKREALEYLHKWLKERGYASV